MNHSLAALQWTWVWTVAFAALFALVVAGAVTFVRTRSRSRSSSRLTEALPPQTLAELIPDSRFVKANGASLHYVQAGEGDDIVLLHGIGASVYIWRFVFPILQTRHRVTAFDFAGFGKSSKEPSNGYGLDAQADSIAKALTSLGIERATLVGSSMGGAVALWMALKWPERFHHVVGLGPHTDSSRVPGLSQHFAAAAPFFRRTVNKRTIKVILGFILTNKNLITDDVVEKYLEPFRDRGESLRAFVAATAVLADRRLPSALSKLKAHALIIWGENDSLVSRASMQKLRKALPQATYVDHATGGHHIMEDEPVWCAKQIELFLAGLEVESNGSSVSSSPR
jgi:4,5:9,10-diseco-3-hydroxy-5,9,17-trioxoandrosta-1(10),2-diene-4-oate hydrolase